MGNGMRLVMVDLKNHVPSQLYIDEHRVVISYVGQAVACFVWNAADHVAQECRREESGRETQSTECRICVGRMLELGGTRSTNDVPSDTAAPAHLTHKPRTKPTQLTYWHPNGIKTETCHVTSLYKAGAAINVCGIGGRGGTPWQNSINKGLMSVLTEDTEQTFAQSFY